MARDLPRNASVIATLSNMIILYISGRGVLWTTQCVPSDKEHHGPEVLNLKDQHQDFEEVMFLTESHFTLKPDSDSKEIQ